MKSSHFGLSKRIPFYSPRHSVDLCYITLTRPPWWEVMGTETIWMGGDTVKMAKLWCKPITAAAAQAVLSSQHLSAPSPALPPYGSNAHFHLSALPSCFPVTAFTSIHPRLSGWSYKEPVVAVFKHLLNLLRVMFTVIGWDVANGVRWLSDSCKSGHFLVHRQ